MGNPKKRISISNRLFLINGGTAVADLNTMAFSASGTSDDRIWGERQTYLGRATNAPRPRFADKSCLRIFML